MMKILKTIASISSIWVILTLKMAAYIAFWRDAYRAFWTPSFTDTFLERCRVDVKFNRPFFQRFGNTKGFDSYRNSSILLLLESLRPSHIANFVMTVIVYPIQRVLTGRTIPQMRQKLLEGSKTELNTTTAIIGIRCIGGAVASHLGRFVCGIFRRLTAPMSAMTSTDQSLTAFDTPFRAAILQFHASPNANISALALASPERVPLAGFPCVSKDVPVSKLLPRKIFEAGMMWKPNFRQICKHFMSIPQVVVLVIAVTLGTTLSVSAQCPEQSQCVPQSTINQAAAAVDELKAARDVIAKFQIERSATEAERGAATALIKGLNDLIATKDKIIGEYERINELYKKAIDFQSIIIERLEKQLNKPKSGWQKFLATLKEVALVLSGVLIGRGF